ncbi:MAG: ABC transporter ATP-binding protein [Deltaproteobacteria bacterium]|nr:ABC transporter ATP-binding protein [Deltaproteobacteria bacterium]
MLEVKEIKIQYGKAVAIEDVTLTVAEESIVSIIGANGAGKTTLLRAISGLTRLRSGEIWFDDKRIDRMDPADIVKMGLIHIPEGRKLFPYLTVLSNLNLGASLRRDKDGIKKEMDEIFEYFPRLHERRNQKAGTLSGGEQEMLAIGRGLMARPKLLLMDEPSLGLAPKVVLDLAPVIRNINSRGVSVLLVEQSIPLVLRVAQWGYALKVGKVVMDAEITHFKAGLIKKAYLGG